MLCRKKHLSRALCEIVSTPRPHHTPGGPVVVDVRVVRNNQFAELPVFMLEPLDDEARDMLALAPMNRLAHSALDPK